MNRKEPSRGPGETRRQPVDVVRGGAIALMIAYHFCFDLNYFGVLRLDMNHDPFWLGARATIVTLFLGTMGVSLYLAAGGGIRWRPYLRRLGLLTLAATAVSFASWFMFPQSWIFFGVLHFIAIATLLGIPFLSFHWANLALGLGFLTLGLTVAHPFFDQGPWQCFGLMTHKPLTEDYVPLLPWFGVVLLGMFLGRALFAQARAPSVAAWKSTNGVVRLLALAGRHGLGIYLLHQPILLGVLWLAVER